MQRFKIVDEMWKYSQSENMKLLSNYEADFWSEYLANSARYDKLFRRMFFSYRYFLQKPCDTIDVVTTDFIDEVYNHLMVNSKRYSELYRMNVIPDDDYSITNNYNVVETMDRDTTSSADSDMGQRVDTSSTNMESTDSVAGFNSSGFENSDKSLDVGSSSLTKGGQHDTYSGSGTEDYTLTRVGNIGVKTVSQVMGEHKELWSTWEFYSMIFKEICAELLIV